MQRLYKFFIFNPLLLFFICTCSPDNPGSSRQETRPVEVQTAKVIKGEIRTFIDTTGTIIPERETFIGPKVIGRIEEFFADKGDRVEKGRPILRLEQTRFKLSVEEAEAAYKESVAHLKNMQQKLKRNQELYASQIIDRDMYETIKTETELAQARADIALSRLSQVREDLKDSVLHAPFSGFVVERKMNIGEFYSPQSSQYVFHIVDTARVEIETHIFETKKEYITIGKNAYITVDALRGKLFEGRISVVNPFIDTSTRRFLVKVEIPNPDFMLEPGMFARVRIPEEEKQDVLIVPADAIIEREGRKLLFVADGNRAFERNIATGITTHDRIELLEGATEGESVITDGLYAVKHQTAIVVREETAVGNDLKEKSQP